MPCCLAFCWLSLFPLCQIALTIREFRCYFHLISESNAWSAPPTKERHSESHLSLSFYSISHLQTLYLVSQCALAQPLYPTPCCQLNWTRVSFSTPSVLTRLDKTRLEQSVFTLSSQCHISPFSRLSPFFRTIEDCHLLSFIVLAVTETYQRHTTNPWALNRA
ncbi:hypothetical protein VTO42DRAFT_6913 [Malbranchea cinnamomea]